jgi:hypothetical protein
LSLVSSVQVAHLLASCVLIGSLAKKLFSFIARTVLAFLQMVDAVLGKVILLMVIILAFKVHHDTKLFHGFSTKNEVMLLLFIPFILNHIGFWIKPFAIRVFRDA